MHGWVLIIHTWQEPSLGVAGRGFTIAWINNFMAPMGDGEGSQNYVNFKIPDPVL